MSAAVAVAYSGIALGVGAPLSAQTTCWPPGAQPTKSQANAPPSSGGGRTTVYFDASGSMATYARPPTKGADAESLYRSLILLLPQTVAALGEQAEFFEFGKKTANDKTEFPKLSEKQLQELTKPTFYCPAETCKYQDSPIADAFKQIAEQPEGSLGMVVTDLFLSNSELIGAGGRELQLPLTKALREGLAVGVLALKTATTGPIYDITQLDKNQCYSKDKGLEPCYKAPQYIGATSRPLFVIMIGPVERILSFKQKLDSDLLGQIPGEHQRFTIFTRRGVKSYVDATRWPKDAFALPPDAEKGEFLNSFFSPGFPGQQVLLSRKGAGLTATVDFSPFWHPGVPPPQRITFEAKSWFQRGMKCERMWFDQREDDVQRLISFKHLSGLKVKLDIAQPSPIEAGLIPNLESYVAAGKMTAMGYRLDSWFGEWGYNEPDELRVLEKRPAFFPAKNLPRIAKVLVDILQEDAEPVPLGEFRIGIKVKSR